MGLVKSMTDEMVKEIGNKTREFYEFVLPPVDMCITNDRLSVIIDMPGFDKKDIRLSLEENVLSVQACRQVPENDAGLICNQRPNVIDKKLRLPAELGDGDDTYSAVYKDGMLTVVIPIRRNGRDIEVT